MNKTSFVLILASLLILAITVVTLSVTGHDDVARDVLSVATLLMILAAIMLGVAWAAG